MGHRARPRHYRTIMQHPLTELRMELRNTYESSKIHEQLQKKSGVAPIPLEIERFSEEKLTAFIEELQRRYFLMLAEDEAHELAQWEKQHPANDVSRFYQDQKQAIRESYANLRDQFSTEAEKAYNAALGGISGAYHDASFSPELPELNHEALQLLWGGVLAFMDTRVDHYFSQDEPEKAKRVDNLPLWRQLTSAHTTMEEMASYTGYLLRHASKMDARVNDRTTIAWGTPKSWFNFSPPKNHVNLDLMYAMIGGFANARPIMFHELGHSQLTVEESPKISAVREELKDIQKQYVEKNKSMPKDVYIRYRKLELELKMRHGLMNAAEDNCVNDFAIMMGEMLGHQYAANRNNSKTTISGHGEAIQQAWKAREQGTPYPALPEDESKHADAFFDNVRRAVNLVFFMHNGFFKDHADAWRVMGVEEDWLQAFPDGNPNAEAIEGRDALERIIAWCGTEGLPQDLAERPLAAQAGLQTLRPSYEEYQQLSDKEIIGRVYDCVRARNEIIDRIWDEYVEHLFRQREQQMEQEIEQQIQHGGTSQPGRKTIRVEDGKGKNVPMPSADDMPPEPEGPGKPGEEQEAGKGNGQQPGEGEGQEAGEGKGDPTQPGGDDDPGEQDASHYDEVELTVDSDTEYQMMLQKLRPEIEATKEKLKAIREIQQKTQQDVSDQYHRFTPGGGVSFARGHDKRRPIQRAKKLAGGGGLSVQDLKDFRGPEEQAEIPPIDIGIMVDGSGSMSGGGARMKGAKQDYLTLALMSGIILYEAARELNQEAMQPLDPPYNIYINMWGADNPQTIAKPGDSQDEVRRNIVRYREGLVSTTNFYYAVEHMRGLLEDNYQSRRGDVGATHLFVISDGDIGDLHSGHATGAAKALLEQCPTMTMDAVMVKEGGNNSNLSRMVKRLNGSDSKHPEDRIADGRKTYLSRGTGWDAIHRGMLAVMEHRAEETAQAQYRVARDARLKYSSLQAAEQDIASVKS